MGWISICLSAFGIFCIENIQFEFRKLFQFLIQQLIQILLKKYIFTWYGIKSICGGAARRCI